MLILSVHIPCFTLLPSNKTNHRVTLSIYLQISCKIRKRAEIKVQKYSILVAKWIITFHVSPFNLRLAINQRRENSFSHVTLAAATSGKTQLIWYIPNQYYIKNEIKTLQPVVFSLPRFLFHSDFFDSTKNESHLFDSYTM